MNWFREIDNVGCGDAFFSDKIVDDFIWYLNEHYKYYGAMLGLWWFLFVVDWAYLVFRYFYEIRTAKEEENTSNRVSTPDSKNNDFNNKNNVIDENE